MKNKFKKPIAFVLALAMMAGIWSGAIPTAVGIDFAHPLEVHAASPDGTIDLSNPTEITGVAISSTDKTITITSGNFDIKGATEDYRVICDGTVTLNVVSDTSIDLTDSSAKNSALKVKSARELTLIINEGMTLTCKSKYRTDFSYEPGIHVNNDATLNIRGKGNLIATGAFFCAGIGGGYEAAAGTATINIQGANVTASGGMFAAGIGSSAYATSDSAVDVNIGENSSVTAIGGYGGAALGSGYRTKGTVNINIEDGQIVASGGAFASGIGSGLVDPTNTEAGRVNVNISGGDIVAIGGTDAAGVGTGFSATSGSSVEVKISGGAIRAIGGDSAAGLGSGGGSKNNSSVKISIYGDGKVTATAGAFGAGIGSGDSATKGARVSINIDENCEVSAKGGYGGAAIGSGYCNDGQVSALIAGGTVIAEGGDFASGIGSGLIKITSSAISAVTVEIFGGSVYSQGGLNGAGIGAGFNISSGSAISIQIAGGTTLANGGDSASGIGSGGAANENSDIGINISGSAIISANGGEFGAGIGSGDSATKGALMQINVAGNCAVSAIGGYGSAGIGSGYCAQGDITIGIENGMIDAQGGSFGSGIGSGLVEDFSALFSSIDSQIDVVISGGSIKATGKDIASGIGHGYQNGGIVNLSMYEVNFPNILAFGEGRQAIDATLSAISNVYIANISIDDTLSSSMRNIKRYSGNWDGAAVGSTITLPSENSRWFAYTTGATQREDYLAIVDGSGKITHKLVNASNKAISYSDTLYLQQFSLQAYQPPSADTQNQNNNIVGSTYGSSNPISRMTDLGGTAGTGTQTTKHWAYDAIQYVMKKHIMRGVSNTEFAPDSKVSRAMVAQVFGNMSGFFANGYKDSPYSDVKIGAWYGPAVAWAEQNGVMIGVGAGKFAPERNMTREELAVAMYNYANSPKGTDIPKSQTMATSLTSFTDSTKASTWAKDALIWATEKGIITGKPNADGSMKLDPKGYATRAEMASMVYKLNSL